MNFDGERVTIKLPKAPATYTPSDQEQFRREVEKSFGRIPGTIPVPSGRTVKSVGEFLYNNADWNLKDLGCIGNGSADDMDRIQAVFDVVGAANGGRVIVPQGTFLIRPIAGPIIYHPNTQIIGKGWDCTIALADDLGTANHIMFAPSAVGIRGPHVENVKIDHRGDVYGNDGHSQCFSVDGTIGSTFRDVWFYRPQTMPLWCDTNGTQDLLVDGCRIEDGAAGGISLFGTHTNFRIVNNYLTGLRDDTIAIQDSASGRPSRGVVANNVTYANTQRDHFGSTPHGILIYGAQDVVVSGNTVVGTVAPAIWLGSGAFFPLDNIAVTGNTVRDAGVTSASTVGVPGAGIYVLGLSASTGKSTNITISGNTITGTRGNGIQLTDVNGVTVNANVVRLSTNNALSLNSTCTDVTVIGNTFLDNGTSNAGLELNGIILFATSPTVTCDRIVITGNTIGDTRAGGSKTQTYALYGVGGANLGSIVFANNIVTGNASGVLGGALPLTLIATNNPGLNPGGAISQGLGASPWTYQNPLNSPEHVTIAGGHVTTVERDDGLGGWITVAGGWTAVGLEYSVTIHLNPGQSMRLTYTAAPLMMRDKQ